MTLFIPRSLRRGAAGYFSGGGRGIFLEYPAAEWKFPFFQNGPLSADANKPPPTSSVRCFASSLMFLCPEAEWKFPFFQNGPLSANANKPPPTSSVRCFASSLTLLSIKKAPQGCSFYGWCPEAESNHRHGDFQSPALPTELSGQQMNLFINDSLRNVQPFFTFL